jgi:NitT/TauT family transport system substrate-binding protein
MKSASPCSKPLRSAPRPALSRRTFLGATGAAGATLGFPAVLRGEAALPRVTHVALATGFTVILSTWMAANRFDLKHGVNIDVVNNYMSVSNYYNDFTAGTFDMGIGAWDTWASRFAAGVPLKMVCSVTDYDLVNLVALKTGPHEVTDLKGKTLSAILSSGAYRLTKHALRTFHGIEIGTDIKFLNTESPAGAVAMVLGGSADSGLTWEPNISVGIEREPNLTPIYNLSEDYRQHAKLELPYFSVAMRNEAEQRNPGVSAKVAAAVVECAESIMANVDEAVRLSADKMRTSNEALKLAFSSGRLSFKPMNMQNAAARQTLLSAADYLVRNGVLDRPVDPGFLAS